MHVDVAVVVVAQLRRGDAEAGQDHGRADVDGLAREVRREQEVLAHRQRLAVDGQRRRARIDLRRAHRHRLHRRLQSRCVELRAHVLGRHFVSARARLAPFQRVVGEEPHVRGDGVRGDDEREQSTEHGA